MARRKQLRRRPSQTSSSTSSSTSPSPSGPPSPSVTRPPAGVPAAGGSYSPGQTLAAARASLKQSTCLVDKQLSSHAVPAAASAFSASGKAAAALPAIAVLKPSQAEAAKVYASADVSGAVPASLSAVAADTSDSPQPDQNCPVLAACSVHGDPATRPAESTSTLADAAESQLDTNARMLQEGHAQPDMDPIRSQQGNAQAGAEAHVAPQPTGCMLPVLVHGSWLQPGAQETVSSCTPVIGMSPSAVQSTCSSSSSSVSAGHASMMPTMRPHPGTALAKPGSQQSVVLTSEAAMHQHSATGLMSHRLDFSADVEDAGS